MEPASAQRGFPRVESPSLLVDGTPRLLSELDSYRPLKLSPASGLAQAFDEACRVYYDRPCLGWRRPNGEFAFVSYARFHSDSRRLAQAFQRTLRAGEHVGICGHNCYEWFLCDFACLWAGLCTVPLSDQWDASVMQHVLSHAHVGAVFTTPAHEDSIRAAALAIGSVSHIVTMSLEISAGAQAEPSSVPFTCVSLTALLQSEERAAALPACPLRSPDAPHTILHSSGTTGMPKGIVYSDRLWLSNMVTYEGTLQIGFSYMPLAYITDRCVYFLNSSVYSSCTVHTLGH